MQCLLLNQFLKYSNEFKSIGERKFRAILENIIEWLALLFYVLVLSLVILELNKEIINF